MRSFPGSRSAGDGAPRRSSGGARHRSPAACGLVLALAAAAPPQGPPREGRAAPGARAPEPRQREARTGGESGAAGTRAEDAPVHRAIDYLASMMGRDGSYSLADAKNPAP